MIEAKGTRSDDIETANPRERYIFGDAQALNKAPLFVATLIAGVFAYLKVALARSAPDEPEKTGVPQPKATKKELLAEEDLPRSQGGRLFDPEPAAEREFADILPFPARPYRLVDSAPLDYRADPWEIRGTAAPARLAAAPGNDNGPNGQGGAGSGSIPSSGEETDGVPPTAPQGPPRPGGPDPRRNTSPTAAAPVLLSDLFVGQVVLLTAAQLLAGAADADGDPLQIRNLTVTGGTLEARAGGWIFRSSPDAALGEVKVSYDITDGTASIRQTATFQLLKTPPIVGTDGHDILLGTERADEIAALDGDDLVDARGGNDTVLGRGGSDHIVAGPGDDLVLAGAGNDIVFGGRGSDILDGGTGNDRLYGEDGNDLLYGGDGKDHLSGGEGDDILSGDDEDDTLVDGKGSDRVLGGAGNDRMLASHDDQKDVFDGGAGIDTLDLADTTLGVIVNLAAGTAAGQEIGNDVVLHVEIVRGGAGDDALSGDANDNGLYGGAGDDTLADGAGEDRLDGGTGDDRVIAATDGDSDGFHGGDGVDTLDLSQTSLGVLVDLVAGTTSGTEIGCDTIASFETFIGGDGDDVFRIGEMAVTLIGGRGDDDFYFDVAIDDLGRDELVHQIMDFVVGDRIQVSDYEIRRSDRDDDGERFEKYRRQRDDDDGADRNPDDDDGTVRIRYEAFGDRNVALIEVDTDFDNSIDLTIKVYDHVAIVEFAV
jgi:Ca2+-binding RTX toxin-like protein